MLSLFFSCKHITKKFSFTVTALTLEHSQLLSEIVLLRLPGESHEISGCCRTQNDFKYPFITNTVYNIFFFFYQRRQLIEALNFPIQIEPCHRLASAVAVHRNYFR